MSVEDLDKVDFVITDGEPRWPADVVCLMATDHLDWGAQKGEHLLTLQGKLNAYLAYIESGQLYTDFPKAIGKKILIEVVGMYPLSDEARRFYRLAGKVIEDLGFSLRFKEEKL